MHGKSFLITCLFVLIGSLLVTAAGDAAVDKPRIVFVEGDATTSADGGSWKQAVRGTRLEQDWVLKTGKKSGVAVVFPDGSEVKLGSESEMKITDLRYAKKSKIVELKLAYGRLLARVKKLLTKESKFNVTAGSAVCGVRGTEFLVSFKDNRFEVMNVEGSVFVRLQDDVRYLEGNRKIRGDMKSLGNVLRLNKEDRESVGEMHRRFRGVAPGDGAKAQPEPSDRRPGPRLGLRTGERGDLGPRPGVGGHLSDAIGHLVADGGNVLGEGSDSATGNVILPNLNVLIVY